MMTMIGEPSSSPELAAARGICSSLHRAYRDIRFYPPGHPMARQSLDALTAAIAEYLGKWEYLTLEVGEDELIFKRESPSTRTSPAGTTWPS